MFSGQQATKISMMNNEQTNIFDYKVCCSRKIEKEAICQGLDNKNIMSL